VVQVAARAEVKDTWLVEAPHIAVDADGDRANRSLLQAGFQLPTSRTGASSSGAEKGFVLRAHGPLTRVRRPEFIQREGGVLVNPKLGSGCPAAYVFPCCNTKASKDAAERPAGAKGTR
jgi:hypothetical protein